MWQTLKTWAQALKRQILVVYFIARDSATPQWLRILAWVVAGYALSPVDLIPDFIPVLGLLDDLLILPLGLALVLKYVPQPVLQRAGQRAHAVNLRPVSRLAALVIVALWLLLGLYLWFLFAGV